MIGGQAPLKVSDDQEWFKIYFDTNKNLQLWYACMFELVERIGISDGMGGVVREKQLISHAPSYENDGKK